MPYKISEQDGKFCVVKKSDGKVVKCHDTKAQANSHIAALYANEPSVAKKSIGYGMLKSMIEERVEELKGCGANKPGGGGFAAGNTCARGGGGGSEEGTYAPAKGSLVLFKGGVHEVVKTEGEGGWKTLRDVSTGATQKVSGFLLKPAKAEHSDTFNSKYESGSKRAVSLSSHQGLEKGATYSITSHKTETSVTGQTQHIYSVKKEGGTKEIKLVANTAHSNLLHISSLPKVETGKAPSPSPYNVARRIRTGGG